MRKALILVTLSMIALSNGLYAEDNKKNDQFMDVKIENNSGQRDQLVIGRDIPYTKEPSKDYVKRYRFELDSDKFRRLYDLVFSKVNKRKKILKETFNISILMKPSYRNFKSVDHLYLAKAYITQIVFPVGFKISDAVASFPTTLFDFSENEVRVRPTKDFTDGNIVVHLSDGTKNYSINIVVEEYSQKKCFKKHGRYYCLTLEGEKSPLYSQSFENVALVYKYNFVKPIDDIAVIYLYQKLYGKKLNIKKDGDFVAFEYKGVTYYIYRNDKFGNVFYGGKRYIVKK